MTSVVHHLRSKQILSKIDAAKEQKLRNETIRNILLDSEDVLVQMHSQLFSTKMRTPIEAIVQEANANLKHFEKNLSYSHCYMPCPISQYWKDTGLTIDPEALNNSDSNEGNTISLEEMRRVIDFIPKAGVLSERYELLLRRCDDLVGTARLDTIPWMPVSKMVLGTIRATSEYRHITDKVSVIDEKIAVLSFKCKEFEDEEAATENSDVTTKERLMKGCITSMEEIIDMITQKLNLIEEETEVVNAHRESINNTREGIHTFVAGYRERINEQKALIDKDLESIEKHASQIPNANSVAKTTYESMRCASDLRLDENRQRSCEIWDAFHSLEKELNILAVERRDEIDRLVKLIEREERREVEVANFTTFVDSHTAVLQAAVRHYEAQVLLTDMLEEMSLNTCDIAKSLIKSGSDVICQTRRSVEEEYYSHFRKLYLLQGGLQFMQEQVLDRLRQRAVVIHSMQEMVTDSSCQKARDDYCIEKRGIEEQIDSISSDLDILRHKADLYVEGFSKTEETLRQNSSQPFEHPVQELNRINRERRRRITIYHEMTLAGLHSNTIDQDTDTM